MQIRSQTTADKMMALALVALGVLFRVAPHPDNFTPVTALAIFSGAVLPPSLALTVPLLIMMASDLVIGLHSLFWLVWPAFLLVVILGIWAGKNARPGRLLAASVSGSVIFFVVSNLGVFFFQNMYPKNWEGLVECFTMALPFFRNALAGDIFYTAVFFSLFLAAQWMRQSKKAS